jgi:hypothetical protein
MIVKKGPPEWRFLKQFNGWVVWRDNYNGIRSLNATIRKTVLEVIERISTLMFGKNGTLDLVALIWQKKTHQLQRGKEGGDTE